MNSILKKIVDSALGLLYPRICPVCGSILPHVPDDENNPFICEKCFQYLSFPDGPRCLRCSRPILDELEEYCSECRKHFRHYDRGISLMMHEGAARKIIYDLKFSNKRDNADMLAYEAAKRCFELIRFWNPDVLIPVPLHRKKELARGFNQSFLLAKKLAYYLEIYDMNIPVDPDILVRCRQTLPMKELSGAQRADNIKNAFAVASDAKAVSGRGFKYKTVLLVDDIYTTGATLSECAGVLKEAGAAAVYYLTFTM